MRTSTKWVACLAGLGLVAGTAVGQSSGQPSGNAPASGDQSYGTQPSANQQPQAGAPSGQPVLTGNLQTQAQQTIAAFKQADPSLNKFFQNSAGYAVFPKVTEGALIVGGAHGNGVVYQNGQPVGEATLSKANIGAQAGGQTYSELIFFQTPQALQQFKASNYQFSAGVSAVAAAANAGQAANYNQGVAVFTFARQGLMAQAAVGGQKFTYQPLSGTASGNEGAVGGSTSPGDSGSSSGQGENTPK